MINRQENSSHKGITGQEFGSQKGITEQELDSQINLRDGNWALKYHYRMGEPNSSPVRIFESQIPIQ